MDLDECNKKGHIIKIRINSELIKSIIEISNTNENTVKNAALNESNIISYVSLAYDSLRITMEAICLSRGYKVLSHICLGELVKILDKDFNFIEFDRWRYIRNGINYYGTKIDYSQGKEIINKMFLMKRTLIKNNLIDYLK